jgi:hypothetical protein
MSATPSRSLAVRLGHPALWVGLAGGLGCQVGALAQLARDLTADTLARDAVISLVSLHLAGALLAAGGLAFGARLELRARAALLFLPALLFGSVLGTLGWVVVLATTARRRRSEPAAEPEPAPSDPPAPLRTDIGPVRGVGRGSLFGRLRFARDPSVRLRAVMAARRIAGPGVVSLLKLALRDPAEDVRLLGYSILERRQGAIYRRIQEALRELEQDPSRSSLQLELAQQYWELVYQGLVGGDLQAYLLAKARSHLEKVIAVEPRNPSHQLLLGRIQLRQRAYDEAAISLRRARAFGLPARVVNPHAAELAWAGRRFSEVRRLLQGMGQARPRGPVVSRLIEYWQ